MSGWVKVCGITTAEAVTAAAEAGVDAIGFVFAPSPRRVNPERAAELALGVRQLAPTHTRTPTPESERGRAHGR